MNTNGENGELGFSIEGPSKAKIEVVDQNDGTADVTYYPTAPGLYAVHVLCDGEDIPKSPYMATIVPKAAFDSNKVVEELKRAFISIQCYHQGIILCDV